MNKLPPWGFYSYHTEKPSWCPDWYWLILRWFRYRKTRDAGRVLDFEHQCCFYSMVENIFTRTEPRKYGQKELVRVHMASGRMAMFLLETTEIHNYGGTGQRDWKFEFQGYLP